MPRSLITAEVAEKLGCTASRVQQLDNELRPERAKTGQRLYDPAVVEAYVARCATRRSGRSS